MTQKTTLRATANDLGLLALRIGAGGLMLFAHGWPKLVGFSEKASTFKDPLGIGPDLSLMATIGTEVGAALLIMVGLATRPAAASLLFTMGVAAFIVHGEDPFSRQEKALLFGVMYLVLLIAGPGRASLDHLITRRRKTS